MGCCQPTEFQKINYSDDNSKVIDNSHYNTSLLTPSHQKLINFSLKKSTSFDKFNIKNLNIAFQNEDFGFLVENLKNDNEINEEIPFFTHEWADIPENYNTLSCVFFAILIQNEQNQKIKQILFENHKTFLLNLDRDIENKTINYSQHFYIFLFFYLENKNLYTNPKIIDFIKKIFEIFRKIPDCKYDFFLICLNCIQKSCKIQFFHEKTVELLLENGKIITEILIKVFEKSLIIDENTRFLNIFRIVNFLDEITQNTIISNNDLKMNRNELIIKNFKEHGLINQLKAIREGLLSNISRTLFWNFVKELVEYMDYLFFEFNLC